MSLKSHAQLLCYFPSVLSNFATVVSWSRNLVKLHNELVSLYLIFGKERLVVLKVLLIITKKFVVTKHLRMRDMCQFSISNLIGSFGLHVMEPRQFYDVLSFSAFTLKSLKSLK